MKNKFTDLNNHLFSALERISDEDLKGKALAAEVSRAQSISNVARQIIGNANLVMKAKQMQIANTMTTTDQRKLPEYFDAEPQQPKLGVIDGKKKQA